MVKLITSVRLLEGEGSLGLACAETVCFHLPIALSLTVSRQGESEQQEMRLHRDQINLRNERLPLSVREKVAV